MSPQDFILPLITQAPAEVIGDWYGMHVRIGETLGARLGDDKETVRFTYADEPTLDRPGCAVRIRCNDAATVAAMKAFALPSEPSDALAVEGGEVQVSITMSGRVSRRYDVKPIEGVVIRALRRNGFELADDTHVDVQVTPYGFRKGHGRRFTIPGCRLKLRARIADAEMVRCALAKGIGRDRGMGFGMIVLGEVS
ncbi:type I-E CRISPR-associated protein Cas6/Cse3/CasE [Epibacterium sp. DP7N7-1]|nr:type I-E CRISPR-associated protein Cas6/Cse3/CasE [Epibacterium sp. DP7N7-1]